MLATGPMPAGMMVSSMDAMLTWGVFRWPRGQPNMGFCWFQGMEGRGGEPRVGLCSDGVW